MNQAGEENTQAETTTNKMAAAVKRVRRGSYGVTDAGLRLAAYLRLLSGDAGPPVSGSPGD